MEIIEHDTRRPHFRLLAVCRNLHQRPGRESSSFGRSTQCTCVLQTVNILGIRNQEASATTESGIREDHILHPSSLCHQGKQQPPLANQGSFSLPDMPD